MKMEANSTGVLAADRTPQELAHGTIRRPAPVTDPLRTQEKMG